MSTPFVRDTSVAVSWCFEKEFSVKTDALFDQLLQTYAEVPALFFYELQNVLRRGERQGKTTPTIIKNYWERLLIADIRIETLDVIPVEPTLIYLARKYSLSSYDAAYFELAQRKNLPLATQDNSLRLAASSVGIPLLP